MNATVSTKKIPPALATTYVRKAIQEVAERRDMDFLLCEDTYHETRSALAHVLKHDRYRTRIEDRVQRLVSTTRELLAHPEVEKLSARPGWVQDLHAATDDLEQARLDDLATQYVDENDILIFLEIIDAIRALHIRFKFDPSCVITAEMFVFANMVAKNFAVYEKTINS